MIAWFIHFSCFYVYYHYSDRSCRIYTGYKLVIHTFNDQTEMVQRGYMRVQTRERLSYTFGYRRMA